jgi:hypothetical protein
MNDSLPIDAEQRFIVLTLRYLDGVADPEEKRLLADQLHSDAGLRRRFVIICRQIGTLHEMLSALGKGARLEPGMRCSEFGDEGNSYDRPPTVESHEPGLVVGSESPATPPLPPCVLPLEAAPAAPSYVVSRSLSALNSLLASAAYCYTLAGLAIGACLLAAWLWGPAADWQRIVQGTVLPPVQTGMSPSPTSANGVRGAVLPPVATAADSGLVIVGKITGTSNCRWAHPCVAAGLGDSVPLGRKYPITSGLLEITYDSGAKVIIEGPAIYLASSRNGGGLYFGKVTASAAKLDRAKLISVERALGRPAPSPSVVAFCVHTPSAIVTDDGSQATQFGVEVDRSQATYTHVFQGLINVGTEGFEDPYPASAGTCVWTGAGAQHKSLFIFKPGPQAAIFVTKMPKPPPVCLTQPPASKGGRTVHGGS